MKLCPECGRVDWKGHACFPAKPRVAWQGPKPTSVSRRVDKPVDMSTPAVDKPVDTPNVDTDVDKRKAYQREWLRKKRAAKEG